MYEQNYKDVWKLIVPILFVAFIGWDHANLRRAQIAEAVSTPILETTPPPSLSSISERDKIEQVVEQSTGQEGGNGVVIAPTPTPSQKFDSEIEEYIYKVFGKDYDKAMLLLRGNKYCSGENPSLNPKAVNVNKDGSRDRGIFQINDKFHPLTDRQAFDYKQNVNYSYRMFENDNFTFSKRWTAGRCLAKNGYEI